MYMYTVCQWTDVACGMYSAAYVEGWTDTGGDGSCTGYQVMMSRQHLGMMMLTLLDV